MYTTEQLIDEWIHKCAQETSHIHQMVLRGTDFFIPCTVYPAHDDANIPRLFARYYSADLICGRNDQWDPSSNSHSLVHRKFHDFECLDDVSTSMLVPLYPHKKYASIKEVYFVVYELNEKNRDMCVWGSFNGSFSYNHCVVPPYILISDSTFNTAIQHVCEQYSQFTYKERHDMRLNF